jgi:hypothetical protein
VPCRDVSNPLPESIDLLEDMVVEYVVEMVPVPAAFVLLCALLTNNELT